MKACLAKHPEIHVEFPPAYTPELKGCHIRKLTLFGSGWDDDVLREVAVEYVTA